MEMTIESLISAIVLLLPGFFGVYTFYISYSINAFTTYSNQTYQQTIVMALIFSTISNGLTDLIFNIQILDSIQNSIQRPLEIFISSIFAVILGIFFSMLVNNYYLYRIVKKFNIKNFQRFTLKNLWKNSKTEVILHFGDGSRLAGCINNWPADPQNGNFFIDNVDWLMENNTNKIMLPQTELMVIKASNVIKVEFLKNNEADTHENKGV